MKYDNVIFDIDGTMVDSEQAVRISLSELMKEELGVDCDPSEVRFSFGGTGVNSLKALGFSDPVASNRRWANLLLKHLDSLRIFPGILELVGNLKENGVKLGIVTSKQRYEYEEEFLKPFPDLAAMFQAYICADDTSEHKPKPAPLLACLEKMNLSSNKTLYIGDTRHDYDCALGAGVDFALACWGSSEHGNMEQAFYAERPSDILTLL